MQSLGEAKSFQELFGFLHQFASSAPWQPGDSHIFDCGETGQKMGVLEDQPDRLGSEGGQLPLAQCGEILTSDADLSACWVVETRDEVQQRGLARTGWASDGDDFARVDDQINFANRAHSLSAAWIDAAYASKLDYGVKQGARIPAHLAGHACKRAAAQVWRTYRHELTTAI